MRKSLIIMLLLLALCIGGFWAAHAQISAAGDDVVLTETVLLGGPAYVQGLRADLRIQCNYHLFWDTVYTAGSEPETQFRFSQQEEYVRGSVVHQGLSLEVYGDFGISGSIDLNQDAELYGMAKPIRDVASRTPAGQEHSETVLLSDYYDSYPIFVTLDLPGGLMWNSQDRYSSADEFWAIRERLNQKLKEFFVIPVLAGHRVTVSIEKDPDGTTYGVGVSSFSDSGINLWSYSAVTPQACYFSFNNRTWDGGVADTSHIPGGYGVYRLPYATGDGETSVEPDGLATVCPLDAEATVEWMGVSNDQGEVLFLVQEDGRHDLMVLDGATGAQKQRLPIAEGQPDQDLWEVYCYDDFLAVHLSGDQLVILESTPDGYCKALSARISKAMELGLSMNRNTAMAWDGNRLAIASFLWRESYYDQGCGFYLAAFDENGLNFCSVYHSSLDAGPELDYSQRCLPVDADPLQLYWQ